MFSIEKKSNSIIDNQSRMLSKKDSIIGYKNKQINLIQQKKTSQARRENWLGVEVKSSN